MKDIRRKTSSQGNGWNEASGVSKARDGTGTSRCGYDAWRLVTVRDSSEESGRIRLDAWRRLCHCDVPMECHKDREASTQKTGTWKYRPTVGTFEYLSEYCHGEIVEKNTKQIRNSQQHWRTDRAVRTSGEDANEIGHSQTWSKPEDMQAHRADAARGNCFCFGQTRFAVQRKRGDKR